MSCLLYCGCLIAACLMEPSRLRSIVAFSAAATLLYTPLFKRLTAIKNATVAMVIALAPIAGALAAGAVSAVLGKPFAVRDGCNSGCHSGCLPTGLAGKVSIARQVLMCLQPLYVA
jgi:hypothetical protein